VTTSERHRDIVNILILIDRVNKLVRGDGFLSLSPRFDVLHYYFIIRDHDRRCGRLTGGGYNTTKCMRPHEHCGGGGGKRRNGLHLYTMWW